MYKNKLLLYKSILFGVILLLGLLEIIYIFRKQALVNKAEVRITGVSLLILLFTNFAVINSFTNLNIFQVFKHIQSYLPYSYRLTWIWWLLGLITYEFFYWLHHFLAHKVRLLWCIHSPHHSPTNMNLFVGFNHSLLESLFVRPFFVGFMPMLLGINPIIIVTCNIIDTVWGCLLHVSEETLNKRLGPLEYFLQTPSHHRVHHSSDQIYIDRNFCSITLLWDYVFDTYKTSNQSGIKKMGLTREVDTSNFWDMHFGDVKLLWRDVQQAPTLKLKLLHIIMPPDWHYKNMR